MSDQQSLAKRSPRSRKSLSSGGVTFGSGEQENRTDGLGLTKGKGKGRAASIGGAELIGASSSLKIKLTPKKTARRALAPRKSILKQYNQDDTQTYNYNYMDGQGQDDEDGDTQFIGGGTESTTMRFRRRVSFAAHAHVRMFEIDPSANQLSQSQSSVPSNSSQQQLASAPLPLATSTSNIYGAPEPAPTTSRRRSSAGGAGGHSRRASVQGVEAFTKSAAAVGFVPISSSSRRNSAVSEGSVDMDIESDEEEEEEQQNDGGFSSFQLNGPPSAPFEGNNSTSSSGTPFTFGIPNPPTIIIQRDEEDEQSEEEDGDMSLDNMDETQVHGGIISAQPPLPSASVNKRQSLTHPTSPSASTEDGDSDEDDDGGLDSLDPDDKTMDFTVATGGIIPTSAPATAAKNVRASLGYAIEVQEAERMAAWSKSAAAVEVGGGPVLGSAAARRAAAAAEEEMRWDGDGVDEGEDSGSEMDFTRVIGGIIERSDEGAGEEAMDEGSTMDMTRVMGGIISSRPAEDGEEEEEDSDEGGEMDMDETVAVGGLIMQRREEDNTTRRSIFDRDDDDNDDNMDTEAGGMDFTVARGGIFASNDAGQAPAPPAQQQPLFGRSSLSLSSKSPAKSPRKSLGAFVPPTPTRPLESSVTRPTASSAAKVKLAPTPRSIFDSPAKPFAPIPSKGKPNTPGSARKLVFGAVASPGASAAKKRGVEEMEAGGGEGSSIFSTKSPKRRSSARGGGVEEDVFGSVAGSGGGNGKGKGRESPMISSGPSSSSTSNGIFGSYHVEANIFTAPELPPSPKKASAAPSSSSVVPSSPVRNIFTKATSPSPIKGPATIFDIPTSASNSSEQATSSTSIFSTSPRVAPPPATVVPAALPRSSLAFAEPSVPSSASSSFLAEQAAPLALAAVRATPKKKLGRPSLGVESSRREREMDVEMMVDEAHQAAPVSLGQFLDMTGLTFMDKMHPRRRSTIGPGEMLGIHRNNNDTTRSMAGREYQTIEYANYVLSFPYLAIYQWACNHLKESTIQSQQTVQNLDHDASEINPVLFREYLEAEDDEKGMIEAQLKYLKVYSHLLIKRRWREWRLDLIVKLKATHEADLADLQEDRAKIQELSSAFEQQTPLSTLRTRHEALRLQLEQERQKVAEVLACDQNELSHRRSDIKEQNDQIDSLKADLADQNVMLNSLTTKFNGLDLQRQAAQEAIDHAAGIWADTQGFTREKVFRLKEEFDTLEHLHSVKITSVRSDQLEMVFEGALKLVLASEKFQPVVAGARVEFVKATKPRRNEVVLGHLFELVRVFVEQMQVASVPELVQTISHMWSSASRIATGFHLISLRYPVTYSPSSTSNSLRATVPILLPPVKARILVSFDISAKTILQWPGKIGDLGLGVKVAYGKVDSIILLHSVRTRLEQATPESHFGTLVSSCLEAVERYK